MSDLFVLIVGSYWLLMLGLFGWSIVIMALVTRALIRIPRELAAIRRALDSGRGGDGGTSPDTGAARPEARATPAHWTATSPLGRL